MEFCSHVRWERRTRLDAKVGERLDGSVGRLQALLLLLLEGELRAARVASERRRGEGRRARRQEGAGKLRSSDGTGCVFGVSASLRVTVLRPAALGVAGARLASMA